MTASLLLLCLGMLIGAGLLFAAVLMPAVFRLLPQGMARAFISTVFSLCYLFGASLSGGCLALAVALPCLSTLAEVVLALVCGSYVLAWRELAPRIQLLRDRGDGAGLRRIEQGAQVLNTAQLAVATAVFFQVLNACQF